MSRAGKRFRAGPKSALRGPNFRAILFAQTVSSFGDAAFFATLAWYAFDSTKSSGAVSTLLASIGVAGLASLLVGGAVADAFDRRRLLVGSDFARFLLMAGLAFVAWRHTGGFGVLVGLATLSSLFDGVFGPACSGLVSHVCSPEELASANGYLGFARSGVAIVGAASGGLLYACAGAPLVFGLQAMTFFASGVVIARMPFRSLPMERSDRHSVSILHGTLSDIGGGLRYVLTVPLLRSIPIAAVAVMLADGPTNALFPAVVRDHWGGGARLVGGVNAALGLGAAAGSLLAVRLGERRRLVSIVFGSWAAAHFLTAVMLVQGSGFVVLSLSFVRGLLGGCGGALWGTVLMQRVDERMISRVFSVDSFGASVLTPLGVLAAGMMSGRFPAWQIAAWGQVLAGGLMVLLFMGLPRLARPL